METLLQELKKFVISWGWTYAVIWKIGPDHRTPVWLLSYFNEREEREVGQAQLFENIFRSCRFTPIRQGYAYLAWQRQSPYWWSSKLMEPVPTDENKELFLTHAKIQTLVCFPERASTDGSGYCVELACTSEVSESENLKAGIQDFISTSIAPHISSTQLSVLEEVPALTTSMSPTALAMAAVAFQQDSDILTDINIQASMHGEDEAIAGFGNIVNREELYYPWTMSSSHSVNADLSPFNYPLANFGDHNYQNLDISTFNYGGSSPVLGFPGLAEGVSTAGGQTLGPSASWTPTSSGTATHGSRKGKEILVEEPLHKESITLPPTLQNFSSLQQESLEKLGLPPALQQVPSLGPSAQDSSKMIVPPPGYRIPSSSSSAELRPIGGKVPPGHSPRSLFQPHRHAHYSRFGSSSKRPCLIYKWATDLAPQIPRIEGGLQGPGSSGAERLGTFAGSSATHNFDTRSPNSLAHDHLVAEAHKMAERKRRFKMKNKLRTLISVIPIIDKKDKVSVLTSTIEYIRQLTSRISNFEGVEEAAAAPATTLRIEEEATMIMDRDEELALFNNIDSAGAGPSFSSPTGAPVVKVEDSKDSDKWLVEVQANNLSRSLIQLLNAFQELGLEVITLDYGTMNGRFRANICIKAPRNSSTSSSELQAILCTVLETVESSTISSD